MTQLADLSKPFKGHYVKTKPGASHASYVEHNTVTERLLLQLGGYSWQLVEILRADFTKGDQTERVIQGVVYRLTVELDGRVCVIEEVGDVEHPFNWKTEGARLKDATSDAMKRCAMRIGCGLHLWSGELYFLDGALDKISRPDGGGVADGNARDAQEAAPSQSGRGRDGSAAPKGDT